MVRFLVLWLSSLSLCPLLCGQDAFYLQALEDGKNAMADGKWAVASQHLEIAAFGLLDQPALLAETYVRLSLVAEGKGDTEMQAQFREKAAALLGDPAQKPAGLPLVLWKRYLGLSRIKTEAVEPLVVVDPPAEIVEDEAFWLQQILDHLAEREYSRAEKAIEDGLAHYPESLPLLERAINFSVRYNRARYAREYSDRALKLDPNCSIANEYLGNRAVKDRRYEAAKAHYAKVTAHSFGATASLQQRLKESYSSKTPGEQQTTVLDTPPEAAIENPADEANKLSQQIARMEADIAAEPNNVENQYDLVSLYFAAGDLTKARRTLRTLGRSEYQNPRYAEYFAQYYYLRQDYRKNISNFAGKSRVTPKTRLYLGLSYYQLGEYKQAATTLAELDRGQFPELEAVDRDIQNQLSSN